MVNICYRTQPSDAYVRRSRAIFYAEIGDVVRHIRPALLQMPGITINGMDVKNRCDGRKDRALQPGRGPSLCIYGRLHIQGGHGIEVVELDVVFPRPDHLYWTADFLRENSRFGHVIGLGLSSEAATEQRPLTDDIPFFNSQSLPT